MRKFPMIPGIDLSGIVIKSSVEKFKEGDEVLATGSGLSEVTWGGYSEYACLNSNKIVHIPKEIGLKNSMAIGTAGFTAMLCIMALQKNGINKEKNIIVTGASGGVGSIALVLLSKMGYSVTGSTGDKENFDLLKKLGASDCILRDELIIDPKPIASAKWGGAIDTVGGQILSTVISQLSNNSSVSSCGNVAGINLNTSVLPFILRGVNLLGIDSVNCPYDLRLEAWSRLANNLPYERLENLTNTINFDELFDVSKKILNGEIIGRTVVKIS